MMALTQLRTLSLAAIGGEQAPVVIATGLGKPTRVLVRNVSSVAAFLGLDANDLKDANSSSVYRLPNRVVDVLILEGNQTLFALGETAGAQLSIAVSEAFPTEIRG